MTAPLGLTKQQRTLLDFLHDREAHDLQAPSLDEMAAAIGLKSKSGALRLVCGLEERGYLVRKVARVRSVRLVHHRSHPVVHQLRDALINRLADLPADSLLTPLEVMRLVRDTPLDDAPAGKAPSASVPASTSIAGALTGAAPAAMRKVAGDLLTGDIYDSGAIGLCGGQP